MMLKIVIATLTLVLLAVPPAAVEVATGPLDPDGHLAPGGTDAGAARKAQSSEIEDDPEIRKLLEGRYVDSVSVDLVMVPAVVQDKKGRPVLDLKAEDFTLLDEGQPQMIEFFALDHEAPISVAFLLDVSGSMRVSGNIEPAKAAVRYFLWQLEARDEVSLYAFADRQVAELTAFSTDRTETRRWLKAVKAYGQTALNDAVAAAPGLVDGRLRGRKALILLTDGVDNYSEMSLQEAVESAREVDVPIYVIGFEDGSIAEADGEADGTGTPGALRTIAAETGGAFLQVHDRTAMEAAVRTISRELHTQYVLGYTPPAAKGDGFRRISLTAENGRYRVRTRKGYVLN